MLALAGYFVYYVYLKQCTDQIAAMEILRGQRAGIKIIVKKDREIIYWQKNLHQ